MKKLDKIVFAASLLALLNACAGEEGYKVQIEPTLPVPILIVPDHGSSNVPNNNQNAPYQQNNQSDHHRAKRQRSNASRPPVLTTPPYDNAQQPDYRY